MFKVIFDVNTLIVFVSVLYKPDNIELDKMTNQTFHEIHSFIFWLHKHAPLSEKTDIQQQCETSTSLTSATQNAVNGNKTIRVSERVTKMDRSAPRDLKVNSTAKPSEESFNPI